MFDRKLWRMLVSCPYRGKGYKRGKVTVYWHVTWELKFANLGVKQIRLFEGRGKEQIRCRCGFVGAPVKTVFRRPTVGTRNRWFPICAGEVEELFQKLKGTALAQRLMDVPIEEA